MACMTSAAKRALRPIQESSEYEDEQQRCRAPYSRPPSSGPRPSTGQTFPPTFQELKEKHFTHVVNVQCNALFYRSVNS